ncbi:hypothetical protein FRC02_008854 [Tulasnella sp. 418]|nr:hypothetical protein FRC02_008854 [Tulasnella sp. 418]
MSSSSSNHADLIRRWTEEQNQQARQLVFEDDNLGFAVTSTAEGADDPERLGGTDYDEPTVWTEDLEQISVTGLKYVGGLDISFVDEATAAKDPSHPDAYAAIVVLEYPSLEWLHKIVMPIKLTMPYIPSFLSYREAEAYLTLIDKLRQNLKDIGKEEEFPQVLLVDGNGRLHVRQAGSASIVGLKSGIPTIGVAKNYYPPFLRVPRNSNDPKPPYDWRRNQYGMKKVCQAILTTPGSWFGIFGADEAVNSTYVGAAICPPDSATNAIFISPGHRISLLTSIRLAMALSLYRIPEPVRLADKFSRRVVSASAS